MTSPLRALAILSTFGVIGGAGALINHYLFKETIREILTKKGHTFFTFEKSKTEEKSSLLEIIKAYSTGINKFEGFTGTGKEGDLITLRSSCQKFLNSYENTKSTLLATEQWCTKPISIKELAEKHRSILDTTETPEKNTSEWNSKVIDYFKPNAKNKITDTTLTQLNETDKEGDRKKLKTDCKRLEVKKTYDKDFHESYTQFWEWCTIPK